MTSAQDPLSSTKPDIHVQLSYPSAFKPPAPSGKLAVGPSSATNPISATLITSSINTKTFANHHEPKVVQSNVQTHLPKTSLTKATSYTGNLKHPAHSWGFSSTLSVQ